MRTNVVLNDDLMSEAMRYAASSTKRGTIEEALALFVSVKAAEKRTRDFREALGRIREQTDPLTLRASAVDLLRADRKR